MENPYKLDLPAVVSFSGGRTSGYMLWHILDAFGGKKPDGLEICFQNTGLEHPKTLEFINECSQQWNVPITWLEYVLDEDDQFTFQVVDYETCSKNGEPFTRMIKKKNYLPNPVARVCTANLKIRILQKYLKTLEGFEEGWDNAIGLRADEPHRVHRLKADSKYDQPVTPLYPAGVTQPMVDEWWRNQPFNLNLPLGGNIAGNCVGCFLKGKAKLETLVKEMPEHFEWWAEAEKIPLKSQPEGGRFRNDRPSYELMIKTSKAQGWLFTPEEMAIDDSRPCFCTD